MVSIPSGAFNILNEVITDLFEKPITLYYPDKKEECPNCYLSTLGTGTRSISIYKSGGPYPFGRGQPCPYCGGKGYKDIETTERINARIYWNKKDWVSFEAKMKLPDMSIQVIVKEIDLPKIQRSDYIIPEELNIHIYDKQRYRMSGAVRPQGFQQNYQKYYASFWSIIDE